jgi:hypothetical protein
MEGLGDNGECVFQARLNFDDPFDRLQATTVGKFL